MSGALIGASAHLAAMRHGIAVCEGREEHIDAEGFPVIGTVERANLVLDAVRAFLAAPPTVEAPEAIAARIIDAQPDGHGFKGLLRPRIEAAVAAGVQAGIQAAWESWEPDPFAPLNTTAFEEAAQKALDAAYGDSNDTEIELLQDALSEAMSLLGIELEGRDPDDDDEE